jgi:hypothetical protein
MPETLDELDELLASLGSSTETSDAITSAEDSIPLRDALTTAGKDGGTHGDMRPRSASRFASLPDTTYGTLIKRMTTVVPMGSTPCILQISACVLLPSSASCRNFTNGAS